jgi:acrylyl-CoA reductase (NADPH)
VINNGSSSLKFSVIDPKSERVLSSGLGERIGTAQGLLKLVDMAWLMGAGLPVVMARASEFSATVFPFILRAVRLIGIDSVYCPLEERERAWEEIGKTRPLKGLEEITRFYSLEEVPELAQALLDGKLRGRSLITIAGVEKSLVQ